MCGGQRSTRVLRLERATVDLPSAKARKRLGRKDESLGNFEPCNPRFEELSQFVFTKGDLGEDYGGAARAQALVRHSEHAHLGDVIAGIAGGLDLGRRDILTSANDDFLFP